MSTPSAQLDPIIVDLAQASRITGFGEATLRRMVKAGHLPVLPRKKNGTLRFSVDVLRRWAIEQSRTEAAA